MLLNEFLIPNSILTNYYFFFTIDFGDDPIKIILCLNSLCLSFHLLLSRFVLGEFINGTVEKRQEIKTNKMGKGEIATVVVTNCRWYVCWGGGGCTLFSATPF